MVKAISSCIVVSLCIAQFCFAQQLVQDRSLTIDPAVTAILNQGPSGMTMDSYLNYSTNSQIRFYPIAQDPQSQTPVTFPRPTFQREYDYVIFTQTWFDADSGWEVMFMYNVSGQDPFRSFTVVNDDGSTMLTDTGELNLYWYNGATYLNSSWTIDSGKTVRDKYWRLRSGVTVASSNLAKRPQSSFSSRYFANSRVFQLLISAQSQMPLDMRIVDMRGRTVFRKNQTISKGTHIFPVPLDVSSGAFISDIKTDNEREINTIFPVR